MSQIVPGIYIGGLTCARSEKQLDEYQITHVCSAFQYPINVVSRTSKISTAYIYYYVN